MMFESTLMDHSENTFEFPTDQDLKSLFRKLRGDPDNHGWRVRMRMKFGYFSPGAWYEAVVNKLVTGDCRWIDVGGGKTLFPRNQELSRELAERCRYLVGVDPSDNILANDVVHERSQCTIEQYRNELPFDLATLRMVAEHMENPAQTIDALARLITPGGHVVVFTPNKWTIAALVATVVPNKVHAPFARLLWPQRKDEDVFPTHYQMNTRRQLRRLFEEGGFAEVGFAHLDDCSIFQRFQSTYFLGLVLWKVLRTLGRRYPENNLLGVYRRR